MGEATVQIYRNIGVCIHIIYSINIYGIVYTCGSRLLDAFKYIHIIFTCMRVCIAKVVCVCIYIRIYVYVYVLIGRCGSAV